MKKSEFANRFCRRFVLLILFWGTVASGVSCRPDDENAESNDSIRSVPSRIISTAPSVTEILFELNLGDRVVGVSQFCRYPAEATSLPKVGGLFDPNIETIVQLKPDLVVLLRENVELEQRLKTFNIRTFSVDHRTIAGVLDSFAAIGRECGPEFERNGVALKERITARLDEIQRKTKDLPKPRVLISIDRSRGLGTIGDLFIAGDNPFFNDLIELAGGENVGKNLLTAVSTVSKEGVFELNPDVILDLSTDGDYSFKKIDDRVVEEYRNDWNSLGTSVAAVKNQRIYPILHDYATIPGPRLVFTIEEIARFLHPEIDFSFERADSQCPIFDRSARSNDDGTKSKRTDDF